MPLTTKYIIAEQVMFRLGGGYPDINAPVQREDIYKVIEQKVNTMFKSQQFSQNLPTGETIPENLAIATYEGVAVTSSNSGQSKSTLPVMPISLPRNAGINEIRPVLNAVPSGDRILGQPFIPLTSGQYFLLQADGLLNGLFGQIGYEVNGKSIIYQKDITTFGITAVDMKLIVMDISQYSETDYLPIPADMESQIVEELYQQFSGVVPDTGIVNNFSAAQNQVK